MTWFKIDDGFYDHPKFLDLSNAAVGLWSKAGGWCGRHLTDGVIPASQVKVLKGTRAQIRDLIEAGLWVETTTDVGAKAYRFHDWNDFQPTRELKLKERADSAERQRKSRERKAQEQGESENVTRDSHVTPSRDKRVSHRQVSQRPDPTRPDPTIKEGEVVVKQQVAGGPDDTPSSDDRRGWDDALSAIAAGPPQHDAFPSLDDLAEQHAASTPDAWSTADDPRCHKHKDFPREEVPACRGCGDARRWFEDQAAAQRNAHRSAIEACDMCDGRGLIDSSDATGTPIVIKCTHTSPPAPPERHYTDFRPVSDPGVRKSLLNNAQGHTGPF